MATLCGPHLGSVGVVDETICVCKVERERARKFVLDS